MNWKLIEILEWLIDSQCHPEKSFGIYSKEEIMLKAIILIGSPQKGKINFE